MRRREFLAASLTLANAKAAEPPRPRLFLTPAKLEQVTRKISGSHSELSTHAREHAEGLLARMPSPKYDSEGDMRSNGRGIPWQALVWMVSGDARYREGARRWMLRVCEFPRWEQNN